jgi:hypothetical protein
VLTFARLEPLHRKSINSAIKKIHIAGDDFILWLDLRPDTHTSHSGRLTLSRSRRKVLFGFSNRVTVEWRR